MSTQHHIYANAYDPRLKNMPNYSEQSGRKELQQQIQQLQQLISKFDKKHPQRENVRSIAEVYNAALPVFGQISRSQNRGDKFAEQEKILRHAHQIVSDFNRDFPSEDSSKSKVTFHREELQQSVPRINRDTKQFVSEQVDKIQKEKDMEVDTMEITFKNNAGIEDALHQLRVEQQSLEDKFGDVDATIGDLRDQLRRELNEQQKQDVHQKFSVVEQKITELRGGLTEQQKKEVASRIGELEREISDLRRRQPKDVERKIECLNGQIAELRKQQPHDVDKKISALESQIGSLRSQLPRDVEDKLSCLNANIAELRKQQPKDVDCRLANLDARIGELRKELEKQQPKEKKVFERVDQQINELRKAQPKDVEGRLKNLDARIGEVASEIHNQPREKQVFERVDKQITELRTDLTDQNRKELEEKLKGLEGRICCLRNQLGAQQPQEKKIFERVDNQITELRSELTQRQRQEVEAQIRKLQDELGNLRHALGDRQAMGRRLEHFEAVIKTQAEKIEELQDIMRKGLDAKMADVRREEELTEKSIERQQQEEQTLEYMRREVDNIEPEQGVEVHEERHVRTQHNNEQPKEAHFVQDRHENREEHEEHEHHSKPLKEKLVHLKDKVFGKSGE